MLKSSTCNQSRGRTRIAALELALRAIGAPAWEREYRFHEKRQWRFDLAWPERRLAVEVDGGTFLVRNGRAVGRHARASDYEKLNAAAVSGWRVLRFTGDMVDENTVACAEVIMCAIRATNAEGR